MYRLKHRNIEERMEREKCCRLLISQIRLCMMWLTLRRSSLHWSMLQ